MPEQSPTLRDMIQKAKDAGETYRSLAARAIDPVTGETASYGLLNNIALGKTRTSPEPYHLRAIAVALGVPYEQVRQAAIAQWLPADEAGAADEEARKQMRAEALRQRAEAERLLQIADDALARIDGESGAEHPAPKPRPQTA